MHKAKHLLAVLTALATNMTFAADTDAGGRDGQGKR